MDYVGSRKRISYVPAMMHGGHAWIGKRNGRLLESADNRQQKVFVWGISMDMGRKEKGDLQYE